MATTKIDPNQWVKLLWRVAGRAKRHGETRRELVSAGAPGLLAAVRRFDPKDGRAKFMTFAWRYIRWAICRYRTDERTATRNTVPLDSINRDDPVFARTPDPREESWDAGDTVYRLLLLVPPRSARLLRMKYGLEPGGETLRERADVVGLSPERVRQLEMRAELKLRQSVTEPTPS